jgi:hypothetical protein
MPECFLEILIDIEYDWANGVILHHCQQPCCEVLLVQVREGPAILGPMFIVGTAIPLQKRTGQLLEK